MNQSPQEIIYRRINLLSSLMLAGWLILSLALAMTAILLYGKSRLSERVASDRIEALARQVADLNDRLAQASPVPPAPVAPVANPGDGNAVHPVVARQPVTTAPGTRPDGGTRVSPVAGLIGPDPNRPAGLPGLFYDLKENAAADDDNPMFMLIHGPRTVDETLAELAKVSPADAARAKVSTADRTMAAQLFLQTRRNDQAHRWAAATTQADERAGRAWLIAGLASTRLAQHSRAIAELRSAVERLPGRPEPLKGLGEAYLAADRLDDAVEAYRRAVAAVPKDTALASQFVDLLIRNRSLDDADRELRRILEADPRLSAERAKLAQLMLDRNKPKEALAVLDAAPDNANDDSRMDLARGQAMMAMNDLPGAEAVFEKLVNKDALSAVGWRLLGLTRLQQRKNGPAVVALERSIAINSDDPSAWEYLGVALANDGKIEQAIDKLQEAVRLNISSPRMHYTLAVLYVTKKQPDAAVVSLRKAVELDKTFLDRARGEKVFANEPADSPVAKFLNGAG